MNALLITRLLIEAAWSVSSALRSLHFDSPNEVLRQIDRAEGFLSEVKIELKKHG